MRIMIMLVAASKPNAFPDKMINAMQSKTPGMGAPVGAPTNPGTAPRPTGPPPTVGAPPPVQGGAGMLVGAIQNNAPAKTATLGRTVALPPAAPSGPSFDFSAQPAPPQIPQPSYPQQPAFQPSYQPPVPQPSYQPQASAPPPRPARDTSVPKPSFDPATFVRLF